MNLSVKRPGTTWLLNYKLISSCDEVFTNIKLPVTFPRLILCSANCGCSKNAGLMNIFIVSFNVKHCQGAKSYFCVLCSMYGLYKQA